MSSLARRPTVAVFDLDGTLVDSAPGIAQALSATGRGRKPITVESVRALVSFGADRLVGESLGLSEADIPEALSSFRELYAAAPCTVDHLYPGTRRALVETRERGALLAVCTNKPQHLAERVLERLGLRDLLPVVVGSQAGRPTKPDPASLREALDRTAVGARAVLVGDSLVDALTARACGVPFVFAAFGYGPFDRTVECAATIAGFADLGPALAPLLWPDEGPR